jgi:hypothetical protein
MNQWVMQGEVICSLLFIFSGAMSEYELPLLAV